MARSDAGDLLLLAVRLVGSGAGDETVGKQRLIVLVGGAAFTKSLIPVNRGKRTRVLLRRLLFGWLRGAVIRKRLWLR